MTKKLRYPINKETHLYMKQRQSENLINCKKSKAESWMKEKLDKTDFKWRRQAQWGYRLFDFWNDKLGIAVEVDGKEHNEKYDRYRDDYNYKRSGIIVIRVRNFNEEDALKAVEIINNSNSWIERRSEMDILTKAQKRKLSQVSLGTDIFIS